jgi:hypothetical protein
MITQEMQDALTLCRQINDAWEAYIEALKDDALVAA